MIGRVIEFSVNNKFLMILLTGVMVLAGVYAIYTIRLDAIPDLSDVQVIIFTEYPGQAPRVVEDQVTYPLTTTMLAVPYSKVVRGYSFFGFSFVYIIFEDGTDIYWARSRVLEYLSFVANKLPPGVTPRLGPDATGVGWVYEYSLYSGWYCPELRLTIAHDDRLENVEISYEVRILPVFLKYDRFDKLTLPLTNLDDQRVTEWVENKLLGFLDTYLAIETADNLQSTALATDPVCGMRLAKDGTTLRHNYRGHPYYFCSKQCCDAFTADPGAYVWFKML